MKFSLKLSPTLLILCLAGCKNSSLNTNPPAPRPSANISTATNGLNTQTVTLTNNTEVNISSITTPQISSTLSSILTEDTVNSTCVSATFPLTPGSSCTYVFTSNTTNPVPGILAGTINFSIFFASNTRQNVNLPSIISNYL